MKLPSSFPPPQKHTTRYSCPGGFRRLSRVFSARAAWWLLVVIVAVFAITIVRMMRQFYQIVQP